MLRSADVIQTSDFMAPDTRLLIVDDDPGIRELTAAFLCSHGFIVDTAADDVGMRAALARGGTVKLTRMWFIEAFWTVLIERERENKARSKWRWFSNFEAVQARLTR